MTKISLIDQIRNDYKKDLCSDNPINKQRAFIYYLFDITSYRIGDNETEATGLVTICKKNVITFDKTNSIHLQFYGKSKTPYTKTHKLEFCYESFKQLLEGKEDDDRVFDYFKSNSLIDKEIREPLKKYGILPSTFRHFNASKMFYNIIKKYTEAWIETHPNANNDTKKTQLILILKYARKEVLLELNDKTEGTEFIYIDPRITINW